MKDQLWYCEACKHEGAVRNQEHADVLSVVYSIEDDHHLVSPNCPAPVERIRVPKDQASLQALIHGTGLN